MQRTKTGPGRAAGLPAALHGACVAELQTRACVYRNPPTHAPMRSCVHVRVRVRRSIPDCWRTAAATMYERLYWMDVSAGRYLACNVLPLPPLVSRQRAQEDAWQRRWTFVRQNFGLVRDAMRCDAL